MQEPQHIPKDDLFEPDRLPRHVVVIPDGNRRWASERGLPSWEGHEAGAKNTEDIIREAHRIGVKEISFWGSSLENLVRRPAKESKELLRIYEDYFQRLLESEEVFRDRVRVRIIGRWKEQFPSRLVKTLEALEEKTRDHESCFLNFLLAYSGDDEMRVALQNIAESYKSGTKITNDLIKSHLMTRELPPVDLLIRTGGEPHLSAGFMMWDMANAQLFFSDVLYPDFGKEELHRALREYADRERRYGK